ncbi:MAG: hypothetical protein WCP77_13820 [Roseococcus sp.]
MTTATSITVRVPLAIRHRPGRKTVVTPITDGVAPVTMRADPALVKALARAFRYQRMLDAGRYGSISEMATGERIDRGYLGSLLRLTLLAPDIVEVILNGKQEGPVTLPALMEPFQLSGRSSVKCSRPNLMQPVAASILALLKRSRYSRREPWRTIHE